MKEKLGGIILIILSIYYGFITFEGKAPIPTGFYLILHLFVIGMTFSCGVVAIVFKPEPKNKEQHI